MVFIKEIKCYLRAVFFTVSSGNAFKRSVWSKLFNSNSQRFLYGGIFQKLHEVWHIQQTEYGSRHEISAVFH